MAGRRFKQVNYDLNDAEFNLAACFKHTIQKAFDLYPDEKRIFIARKLGIGIETLRAMIKEWGIVVNNKRYKVLEVKKKQLGSGAFTFKVKMEEKV